MIKNMISCFAHDKNHWINLLEAELPSCSLEAVSTLAIGTCCQRFYEEWLIHQLLKPTTFKAPVDKKLDENKSKHKGLYELVELVSPFQYHCYQKI